MKTQTFGEFRAAETEARPVKDGKRVAAIFSQRRLSDYYTALMNDPNYVHTEYVNNGDGQPVPCESKPAEAFRDAFRNQAETLFGIDKNDSAKAMEAPMSKKLGSAIAGLSSAAIATYLEDGNKYRLPRTSPKQASVTISLQEVEAKEVPIREIGKGESTLTGEVSVTDPHIRGRVENKVPASLKHKRKP